MICTSVAMSGLTALMPVLTSCDLVEVRLEYLASDLDEETVKQVMTAGARVVATHRPVDGVSDARRSDILRWAIQYGAAYVDLEMESSSAFKDPLIAMARSNNCTVIVSYHNFDGTPTLSRMRRLVDDCFAQGADVAKIAVQVTSPQEAARVIGLGDSEKPVIAIGMGHHGRITRVAAPLAGAPFTFAYCGDDKPTAPGQLDRETLTHIYGQIDK